MVTFAPDWADVVLLILRDGIDGATVMSRRPDEVPDFLPLVVCRRSGGSSPRPQFYDDVYLNVQCWADRDGDADAVRVARNLADEVRRVLWQAWRAQTVTPAGHIAWIRESLGPLESTDPDLPYLGRFQATYELRIRHTPA